MVPDPVFRIDAYINRVLTFVLTRFGDRRKSRGKFGAVF